MARIHNRFTQLGRRGKQGIALFKKEYPNAKIKYKGSKVQRIDGKNKMVRYYTVKDRPQFKKSSFNWMELLK